MRAWRLRLLDQIRFSNHRNSLLPLDFLPALLVGCASTVTIAPTPLPDEPMIVSQSASERTQSHTDPPQIAALI
jgi:hypothetical protein